MKKSVLITIFLILSGISIAFAEEPPIESGGWYYDGGLTLNGKWFYDVAKSYKEQDGWAVVGGRKLHYWLYDTYTYHDGKGSAILNKYVPNWVESMGYVIDFDNIYYEAQNDALATSVRALMKQRDCDVSVSLIKLNNDPRGYSAYVVFNKFNANKGNYSIWIYYLY